MSIRMSPHDLAVFLNQDQSAIAAEYTRIRARATQDPGTAGDEGEENWATLLREWLPPAYLVFTKGRIVNESGHASPQIDVIVTHRDCPPRLQKSKIFTTATVVAAFECKLTLKREHIIEAVQTAKTLKSLYASRIGSPYKELYSPVYYGLLAHSHGWNSPRVQNLERVTNIVTQASDDAVSHPRELLDIICIADTAVWRRGTNINPKVAVESFDHVPEISTSYFCHHQNRSDIPTGLEFNPVGPMIEALYRRLAVESPEIGAQADYFQHVGVVGPGVASGQHSKGWGYSICSNGVANRLRGDWNQAPPFFGEWGMMQEF